MRVRSTREQIWRLSINEYRIEGNYYSRHIVIYGAHRQVFTIMLSFLGSHEVVICLARSCIIITFKTD